MSKKKPKYWHNGKIPAELFFEILAEGDKKLLMISGRTSKKKLETAWSDIFDEFFTMKDDPKLRLILRMQNKVVKLHGNIEGTNNLLKSLLAVENAPVEIVIQICELLEKISINIDPKKDLKTQVKRILDFDLSHLKNELLMSQDELETLCKGAKTTYEESIVAIEDVKGRALSQNLSLRKYCAEEKSAKSLSRSRKKETVKK